MEEPIPDSEGQDIQDNISNENHETEFPETENQEWNHNMSQNENFSHDFHRGNFPFRGQRMPRFRRGRPQFFRPQFDEFGGPRMNGFPRGPRAFPPRTPNFHQSFDGPQDMSNHEGAENEINEDQIEGDFENPPMFRGPPMYPGNNFGWRGPGGPPRMFPPRFDGPAPPFAMQSGPNSMGNFERLDQPRMMPPPVAAGGFNQPPPHMMDPNSGVVPHSVPPTSLIPPFRPNIPPMHHPHFGPPLGMSPVAPMGHPPAGVPGRPPFGQFPPSASNQDIWVENITGDGKPYYYSMQTRETRWEKPEGVKIIKQTELTSGSNPTPNKTSINLDMAPKSANEPLKPPEVQAWAEYKTPEGTPYYHNASTGTTVWEKPKVLVDWEVFISTINGKPIPTAEPPMAIAPVKPMSVAPPRPIGSFNSAVMSNSPGLVPQIAPNNVEEKPREPAPPKPKEPKEDPSRPVSSTPVPGTPWCVVWTGDKRVFFFNPSQRLSVWDRPEDLKNREDVDKMVEKYPDSTDEPTNKKPRTDTEDEIPINDENMPKQENSDLLGSHNESSIDPNSVKKEILREAVEKAKIDQSSLPIEERIKQFKEMLSEKQVSAFSTWQKELHKVVFDSRYLLLNSKERKQVFEVYMKERAEEERKEMKNKIKKARDGFRELLKQADVTSKTSFSDFVAKWNKDERYRLVEKSRDRESIFQEYTDELRAKEREQRSKEKNKTRQEFFELLRENSIKKDAHWSDVKKNISKDPRYKAVDSSSRREELFHEFLIKKDSSKHSLDNDSKQEKNRKEREQASLREREKEVKEVLSNSLREREKERDQQMKLEAQANFIELLNTNIKDASLDFKDAKKILKTGSKYDSISSQLDKALMERLFLDHQKTLLKKTTDSFIKMLESNKDIRPASSWKSVKKLIRNDIRYEKLAKTSVKPELEFTRFITEKTNQAKRDFRELLQNSPSISFKLRKVDSKNLISEFDNIFEDVKEDKRYLALEDLDDIKLDLLKDHLIWLEANQPNKQGDA